MNGRRLRAVVRKELLELRRNRTIVATMAFLPLMLSCLAVGMGWFVARHVDEGVRADAQMRLPDAVAHLATRDAVHIVLNDQFMVLILLVPMAIPVAVAAHSIVGEKETRSIEPLLATPVTATELLVGKAAAAVIPAILLGWLAWLVVIAGDAVTAPGAVVAMLVRPVWTLGMLVHAPLLAILSTLTGVIASSRFNDPRAAQGVAAFFILPVLGGGGTFVIGGLFSGRMLSVALLAAVAVGLVLVDLVLLRVAVRLFDREHVLTRWR